MMLKLFLVGVGIMAAALSFLAIAGPSLDPGVLVIAQFVAFLGLLPALMGLFVSPPPEEAGRRIADREVRYPRR